MRADPEDQLSLDSKREGSPLIKWLLVVAVLGGLLFYWYWSGQQQAKELVPSAPAVVAPAAKAQIPPTPDIPHREKPAVVEVIETETIQESNENTAVPTPPQAPAREDGDDLVRRQLIMVGADDSLSKLVSSENPIEGSAALIDGLSRGVLLRKILPATLPKQTFEVEVEGDSIYMSPDNFARFDSYADSVASLDSDMVVDSFHTLRPFYERAYEQLGLDTGDFDNAIIRTLDIILATPEIEGPIELERKSVMYSYVDPELEGLPSVQKLLIRMGPENTRRIKEKAQSIRDGLLMQ